MERGQFRDRSARTLHGARWTLNLLIAIQAEQELFPGEHVLHHGIGTALIDVRIVRDQRHV
ncbi:MAG: hypothetical protein BWX80_01878 [Candidatus Hydrogenedentes bacterium ADurb.Bin101]|nr:MAG: hypothetical protein BWX80_01878 [Candidatus Hydrogenedentes bacterium ADurb.Bin101]